MLVRYVVKPNLNIVNYQVFFNLYQSLLKHGTQLALISLRGYPSSNPTIPF
jgi:hypothetical protein